MSLKGKGIYKGRHWTQLPENKEKLMTMNNRARRSKRVKMQQVAKMLATKAARYGKRGGRNLKVMTPAKQTSLVVNGWRITLGNGEIRIDNE